jgi:hypothetical protein
MTQQENWLVPSRPREINLQMIASLGLPMDLHAPTECLELLCEVATKRVTWLLVVGGGFTDHHFPYLLHYFALAQRQPVQDIIQGAVRFDPESFDHGLSILAARQRTRGVSG